MTIINSGNIKKIVYGGVEYPVASGGGGSDENKILFNIDGTTLTTMDYSLVIPEGITHIGAYTFQSTSVSSSTKIGSVTLPDSLIEIGNYAFEYNNIRDISIPSSVDTIGSYAFRGNNISGTISVDARYINKYAFSGNSGTTLSLGSRIHTIGAEAFAGSDFATSSTWSHEYTFPKSIKKIEVNAFKDCKRWKTVRVPRGADVHTNAFHRNTRVLYG